MFTTRLVPSAEATAAILAIGDEMARRRTLLVPGISLVTVRYPNAIEPQRTIPPATDRIEFLRVLWEAGLPCLLALRPTFPFSVVSPTEVVEVLDRAAKYCVAVLGETFILDQHGQLERRLQLPPSWEDDRVSPLSFLTQASQWRKRRYPAEVAFTRQACVERGKPYFLRSGSAMRLLTKRWSHEGRRLTGASLDQDNTLEMDNLDP